MINKLKTYSLYGNRYCSIEVTTLDGENCYRGVLSTLKKGEFVDLDYFQANSLATLTEKLKKVAHCYISINTEDVLVNSAFTKDNNQDIVSSAFPSLSLKEFYYDLTSSGDQSFVAVARKSRVDKLLTQLKEEGIEVIGFNLGFGNLTSLLDLIKADEISTPKYLIKTSNTEIVEYSENSDNINAQYTIDDIKIESQYLLALAGLNQYQAATDENSNHVEKNAELKSHYSQKTFFKKGVMMAVGIFLLSLLINAMVFSSYHDRLQKLQGESVVANGQKERFAQQQKEISNKEQVVKSILLSGSSKSSFYINQITNSLPESIQLSLLEYQPLEKGVRPDKVIEYNENQIKVEGSSNDRAIFNMWLTLLNNKPWVDQITTYEFKENNTSVLTFGISISIANDL